MKTKARIIELTDPEKQLLALALHSLAMSQGPNSFDIIWATAQRIGIAAELTALSEKWIAHSQRSQ